MNTLAEILDFLRNLEDRKISYRLEHNRRDAIRDAIVVLVAIPGERWELEFFCDGTIEMEVAGDSRRGLTSHFIVVRFLGSPWRSWRLGGENNKRGRND